MAYRIFISSVQREFAKERKALAEYIRKDAILGKFFEVFLFEEVPAQERVYLSEVNDCGIIERCREKGLPPPIWENEDDGFTVTLRRITSGSSEGRPLQTTQKTTPETTIETTIENVPNRQSVGLDVGLESRVLNEVTANPRIKMSEIAVKYHVSKRTVERMFGKLSQDGRIVRVGGKRFGHWEVIG